MIPRDTVVGDAISYLIAEGNDIRLIVLGEATIISPQDPSFDSNKKNAEKIFIDKRLTEAESDLLKGFAPMKNFSLVDRRNIKELLAEWEIGLSGLTSEFRENLHKLYGATHLFVISSQIVMSYKGATEQQITKLIDVRSGKILAVSTRIIKTKF